MKKKYEQVGAQLYSDYDVRVILFSFLQPNLSEKEVVRRAKMLQEAGLEREWPDESLGTALVCRRGEKIPGLDWLGVKEYLVAEKTVSRQTGLEIISAIGVLCGQESLDLLVFAASRLRDWDVRTRAAQILTDLGGPKSVATLGEMVQTELHPTPMEAALQGIFDLIQRTWKDEVDEMMKGKRRFIRGEWRSVFSDSYYHQELKSDLESMLDIIARAYFSIPYPSAQKLADNLLRRLE